MTWASSRWSSWNSSWDSFSVLPMFLYLPLFPDYGTWLSLDIAGHQRKQEGANVRWCCLLLSQHCNHIDLTCFFIGCGFARKCTDVPSWGGLRDLTHCQETNLCPIFNTSKSSATQSQGVYAQCWSKHLGHPFSSCTQQSMQDNWWTNSSSQEVAFKHMALSGTFRSQQVMNLEINPLLVFYWHYSLVFSALTS